MRTAGQMMKGGTIASVTPVTRRQNTGVNPLALIVSLVTIASEFSARRSRPTMSRVTSLRNIPMVPSIATARASSSERPADTSARCDVEERGFSGNRDGRNVPSYSVRAG